MDFNEYIRELHNIYDLYTLDESGSTARGEIIRAGDGTPFVATSGMSGKTGTVRIRSDGASDVTVDFSFDEDGNIKLR